MKKMIIEKSHFVKGAKKLEINSIPCKGCICLPTCRSKSLTYDEVYDYINEELYMKCFYGKFDYTVIPYILMVSRWYLNPKLYPTIPSRILLRDNGFIETGKRLYREIVGEGDDTM